MATPDAQVQSIGATVKDKHELIKFLVGELRRMAAKPDDVGSPVTITNPNDQISPVSPVSPALFDASDAGPIR